MSDEEDYPLIHVSLNDEDTEFVELWNIGGEHKLRKGRFIEIEESEMHMFVPMFNMKMEKLEET